MTDALIGGSGFVGSTLLKARKFDYLYNSKTINEIAGCSFDNVVCAGTSAVKWLANKEPETDLASINLLIRYLDQIRVGHFVLISTIDVYRQPVRVTELDEPDSDGLHSYGLHRLKLERFVSKKFRNSTIIRLPGLFGPGLRKNLIYDLLNNNQTENINPNGEFQWYPMTRFADDLKRLSSAPVSVVNVAVEPIATHNICKLLFPNATIGNPTEPHPSYDVRTNFAYLLGGTGNYHISADVSLNEIATFVGRERGR